MRHSRRSIRPAGCAPLLATVCIIPLLAADARPIRDRPGNTPAKHVLLLSVDGMHGVDLQKFVATHPASALASLMKVGVTYTDARTPVPSDSFPGMLGLATGGTPRTTGLYYDDVFDRTLYKPGSDCSGVGGTEVVFDEAIDYDKSALDAGGGIDPARLPREKRGAICEPVYPHAYLRVNTIFEAIQAAGRRTAWSDKHPAYDLLRGPSGRGIDDLYTPEIVADG